MSGEDLEQTLLRYAMLYNEHLPQAALNSKTPLDAMNIWYASHPQLFLHPPESNRPGCDTYPFPSLERLTRRSGVWIATELEMEIRLDAEEREEREEREVEEAERAEIGEE